MPEERILELPIKQAVSYIDLKTSFISSYNKDKTLDLEEVFKLFSHIESEAQCMKSILQKEMDRRRDAKRT